MLRPPIAVEQHQAYPTFTHAYPQQTVGTHQSLTVRDGSLSSWFKVSAASLLSVNSGMPPTSDVSSKTDAVDKEHMHGVYLHGVYMYGVQ